jgi:hypothetical protein
MTLNGIQTPMKDDLQWKTTSSRRRPQNIKIGNHLLDHTQILNLRLFDQTILCKPSK